MFSFLGSFSLGMSLVKSVYVDLKFFSITFMCESLSILKTELKGAILMLLIALD